jgi:hypothetical protein
MGTWLKDRPGDKDSFATTPQIAQDNFDAIEDIFGQEHYTLNESLCGTHVPGIMGVAASATTVEIATLTLPGSGAIAWDTTVGSWKRNWVDTWAVPGSATKWSRTRAYLGANQSLPADTPTQIQFNTEDYDSMNEFASNTFTALDTGYYLVVASWCASGEAAAGTSQSLGIVLLKTDAVEASATRAVYEIGTETDVTIKMVEIVALNAGATLKVQAYKSGIADIIIAGSDKTFVAVHRLGSQMM